MTLDELHWVPGHHSGFIMVRAGSFEAWKILEPGLKFAGRDMLRDCTPGTYTFRSVDGEEWVNLDPIEAQCVLNHLVGS